ncbi:MCE family protein [Azoarcus indigens]|uniref:Phospholipid/cholesterol/gamma-HCH transport system substrate-binding protein n=1 Tax=Azoarcus indigens TaxID=29545 RepID=A0A4R6EC01_9RHOO|nr:MlaD family protein [Azoarcus indigens]NMG64080.1 MCE family protein [Azoarcus indigens]TDN55676.1 phospholipid/cholesterol/gamma-HCH transport system substrate-binding protein [Azoarcus indigens]
MENRAHALAAGFFVLAMGAALVLALWWFSGHRERMNEYLLVSQGSVNGLNHQARVRFRGIPAGNVAEIRLDPQDSRNILVRISIREEIPLTQGTRARLATQGLTGLAYIQLDDQGGDQTPLRAAGGDLPRLPLEAGTVEQITDTALAIAQRFKTIADQLSTVLDEEGVQRLRNTLARVESASAGMDKTFSQLPQTLESVREILNPANVERISNTLASVERASRQAEPTLVELRQLMGQLAQTAEQVEGTVGRTGDNLAGETLPQVTLLLKELTVTTQRLGILIDQIEGSPQILITGRGERVPGPGEPGYSRPAP